VIHITEATPEEILGFLNDTERKHAPERLYLSGDLDLLKRGARVSIVGSRQPSGEGLARARKLARRLVERGIIVVSGLAEGIDTAAHESAIEHGGRTIAVLGTPLDRTYPRDNIALQDAIMRSHLAVSQFPAGTPVRKWNFPLRNRTMALISQASVIIEAGESSGTLSQGWEALRLGRRLFLMASVAENPTLRWPREMMRYGAKILSEENLEEVLEELSLMERGREAELAF